MKQQLYLFTNTTDLTHGGSKAKDPFHLLRNIRIIEQTIRKYATRFSITIYEIAVHADHIHLSFKVPSRELYRRWIRAITSVLALQITKLKWSLPPYTRVGSWGKDFMRLTKYIRHNKIEGSFLLNAHEHVDRCLR